MSHDKTISFIAKFRILKGLKEQKNSGITYLLQICHWGADFRGSRYFFKLNLLFTAASYTDRGSS